MTTLKHIALLIIILTMGHINSYSQVPFTCEGQLFLSLEPNMRQQLVQVNIDPFSNEAIFSTINNNLGVQVNAIGYRITDNLIYGVDPVNRFLYQIDALGTARELARLNLSDDFFYFAGDVSQDGNFLFLVGSDRLENGARRSQLIKIDLQNNSFPFTVMEMQSALPIYDIAFDPITGVLYGYVSGLQSSQLITIDPDNGNIITQFPNTSVRSAAGLFFDAFGNLYAYGGDDGNNTMYLVNKSSGQLNFYAAGTNVENADAASCPYTIEIVKTVTPEITVPCTEIVYTFKIANGSGRTINGIEFIDQLPSGFNLISIISNPYAGTVDMSAPPGILKIDNMTIPIGVDSILIRVEVPQIDPGIYANQAELNNLPIDLGDFRISDNPNTPAEDDSTKVEVLGTSWDTLILELALCYRDVLTLDASEYGLEFLWSTGSEDAQITITDGGVYSVLALFGCDSNYVQYNIIESEVSVTLPQEGIIDINLGETINFFPQIINTGNTTIPIWRDPLGTSLSCTNCINSVAFPLFDTQYTFTAINEYGCIDSVKVTIRVDKTRHVFAPNVFTPNSDGLNDLFFLQSEDFAIIRTFKIFNRWGDKVYDRETGNIEIPIGWDGRYRGQEMDPAVFVWVAELEFIDGLVEVFSGDVTLLK